jgi:hypothetical protein
MKDFGDFSYLRFARSMGLLSGLSRPLRGLDLLRYRAVKTPKSLDLHGLVGCIVPMRFGTHDGKHRS